MLYLSILSKVMSLALGQSYDCPSASEVTLKDAGKLIDTKTTKIQQKREPCAGIILCMCLANESRRYSVTPSLIDTERSLVHMKCFGSTAPDLVICYFAVHNCVT